MQARPRLSPVTQDSESYVTGPVFIRDLAAIEGHCFDWALENLGVPKNVTYREELVKCGHPGCLRLHGPYIYAYWHERGRLHKKYLGRDFSILRIAEANLFKEPEETRLRTPEYRKLNFIYEAERGGSTVAQSYRKKLNRQEVSLDWAYRRVKAAKEGSP
jgi:hypothetical protein